MTKPVSGFFLSVLAVCSLLFSFSFAADVPTADQLMTQGIEAYKQGSFPTAVLKWTEAAGQFEQDGRTKEQVEALLHLSQVLQQIGNYREAAASLAIALEKAKASKDRAQQALCLGRMGTLYLALGKNEEATKVLNEALAMARELEQPSLTAVLLNDLGNVLAADEQYASAVDAYTESAILAKGGHLDLLAATATLNAAKVSIREGSRTEAKARLDLAVSQVASLPESHDKAFAWLNIGLGYEDLRNGLSKVSVDREDAEVATPSKSRKIEVQPGKSGKQAKVPSTEPTEPFKVPDQVLVKRAAESYWSAIQVATGVNDTHAEAYGWGYLGRLYEQEKRVDEALDLTRRAVSLAQKSRAPESLYQWHWQTARLLRAQQKEDDALMAYRRAINALQPIRTEIMIGSRNRRVSFRDTTGALFFELSDLLLRRASVASDAKIRQELLTQAQDTVELFKAAELQDYFKDECVATARARSTAVADATKDTAVVYPIILPDRLELLVSLPGGLKQFVSPVKVQTLTEEILAFRVALENRSSSAYLKHARVLHDWIIKPIESQLDASGINTLVFVPDGALRTIPMAALYDGSQFLIQKYAVAVTPGLTLTDPKPINREAIKLLAVGLSESVQGFPALPNVANELESIQEIYGGKRLLNDQFKVRTVEEELKKQPFTILHIASHGTVEKDVDNSFILAYDDKITMERLSQLVGLYQYRNAPLELLTLSACETAAGDDRAALGLAGVAIKAGARSALATLWFIDDAATSDLVSEFYRQLQSPSLSRLVRFSALKCLF